MKTDLVGIARITKTRGLRGEVVADILTGFPDRFDNLEDVFGLDDSDKVLELKLEKHWFQNERVVLKFVGFDSIETAESLKNTTICVSLDEVVELGEEEYFDWDLVGCRAIDLEGMELGVVKGVLRAGENENLIVQGKEKEHLIPFVKAICIKVDIENKVISVDPPEGLLDF